MIFWVYFKKVLYHNISNKNNNNQNTNYQLLIFKEGCCEDNLKLEGQSLTMRKTEKNIANKQRK
jgi:hypothetical protein